jgi:hypothetical protein
MYCGFFTRAVRGDPLPFEVGYFSRLGKTEGEGTAGDKPDRE